MITKHCIAMYSLYPKLLTGSLKSNALYLLLNCRINKSRLMNNSWTVPNLCIQISAIWTPTLSNINSKPSHNEINVFTAFHWFSLLFTALIVEQISLFDSLMFGHINSLLDYKIVLEWCNITAWLSQSFIVTYLLQHVGTAMWCIACYVILAIMFLSMFHCYMYIVLVVDTWIKRNEHIVSDSRISL